MTASDFDPTRPIYSVVAWPPGQIDTWLQRLQQELGVRGFGPPHLNLRAPFNTPLPSPELLGALRGVLRDQGAFDVQVQGWRRHPGVIFLACEPSPGLRDLHRRLLEIGPSSRSPYDGQAYQPHLTLALGILPWAADWLWEQVRDLRPPASSFRVEAVSLTHTERAEVQELHTYPLSLLP